MRILPALAVALLLSACGASSPAGTSAEPAANGPANRSQGCQPHGQTPRHKAWSDEFGLAEKVALPKLERFWNGSVGPAALTGEPVLAVVVDKAGKYATRRKGEGWKARTDPDLLHTLRLFAEESFNLDAQVSLCQVVLCADRDAPMSDVLGVQEMLVQARISALFMATQQSPGSLLLLDISLGRERPRESMLLALSRSGDQVHARLGADKTERANWAAELEELAGRTQTRPAMLEISASTLTLLEVEAALNACAKLGMTSVRLV